MTRIPSLLLGLLVLATACTAAEDSVTTVSEGLATQSTETQGNDSTGTQDEEASVTLAQDGCAYEGPSSMTVGQLTVEMWNETSGQFDLHVWMLTEGHSYEELAAHIDEERTRSEAGQPPLGHPAFATVVAEASAEAGASGELVADLAAGTYGLACIFFDEPESLGGIWPVGPLIVSP